jgi:hypothetical protein
MRFTNDSVYMGKNELTHVTIFTIVKIFEIQTKLLRNLNENIFRIFLMLIILSSIKRVGSAKLIALRLTIPMLVI